MDEKELSEIPARDYIYQSNETLKGIIAYYAIRYIDEKGDDKYKLAYELLQLRTTERLVKKTWLLTISTMIVAIATIGVAIATFLLVYHPK